METRKVAYIVALVLVELLAPSDAHAGGTGEYIPPSSSQMVTIPQEEYRQLVEAQVRLQLYEEGQTEYAMTITGANDKLEEAYRKIDELEREKGAQMPLEEQSMKQRLSFGGGVAVDIESNIGGFALAEFRLTDKVSAVGEVLYVDRLIGTCGLRFDL